jgi:predicted glycogen debranching enzyme
VTAKAGASAVLTIVASDKGCELSAEEIIAAQKARMEALRTQSGLKDEVALQLVTAADAYIAQRESTGGKTILAGYPFFGDWGRDTMIALTGCCLSTGRYDDAKSILRTFLQYEQDGLVPNLFPEGTSEPMYNTVDAALLMVNIIWLYVEFFSWQMTFLSGKRVVFSSFSVFPSLFSVFSPPFSVLFSLFSLLD